MELMPGFWPPKPSGFWNVMMRPCRHFAQSELAHHRAGGEWGLHLAQAGDVGHGDAFADPIAVHFVERPRPDLVVVGDFDGAWIHLDAWIKRGIGRCA